MTLQQRSDSLSSAILASAETWLTWRVALASAFVLASLFAIFIFIAEYREIKAAGGMKKYVDQFPTVNYAAVRGIYLSEIIALMVGLQIILHSIVPNLVGEVHTEAMIVLFSFVGAMRGINFGTFWAKRATEKPEVIAAQAAALQSYRTDTSGALPVVAQTKTTENAQGTKSETTIVKPASVVSPQLDRESSTFEAPRDNNGKTAQAPRYPTERDD